MRSFFDLKNFRDSFANDLKLALYSGSQHGVALVVREGFPVRNSASKPAAFWMSYRYFWVSSRIKLCPGLLNALPKEGIPDGRVDNEINRDSEEQFQILQQPEVGIGIRARGQRLEFYQEVQITFSLSVVTGNGLAEQVKPLDTVVDAELLQFGSPLGDGRYHRGLSSGVFSSASNSRLTLPLPTSWESRRKFPRSLRTRPAMTAGCTPTSWAIP